MQCLVQGAWIKCRSGNREHEIVVVPAVTAATLATLLQVRASHFKVLVPGRWHRLQGTWERKRLVRYKQGDPFARMRGERDCPQKVSCHSDTREHAETRDKPTRLPKIRCTKSSFRILWWANFLLSKKWRSREQTACGGSTSHSFIYPYEYFSSINTYSLQCPHTP
jgi:hypothetical protein